MKLNKCILMLACWLPLVSFATTYYVNGTSGSDSNAGTSVALAKKTIQAAVDTASAGDTINVSAGTYAPFSIKKTVYVIGCGASSTIIEGTLNTSIRCVDFGGRNYTSATITGFTLQNSPVGGIAGGKAYQCVIKNNSTGDDGAGALESYLYNCLVVGNYAANGGGGVSGGAGRDVVMYNCTVVGNSCSSGGAGVGEYFWDTKLYNTILCDNYTTSGTLNNVDTWFGGVELFDCCTENPGFVDAANGDYRLASNSSCIDSGNNSYATTEVDLSGGTRILNSTIDKGCYEYGNSGGNSGSNPLSSALDFELSNCVLSSDGSTAWTVDTSTYYYGGSSLKSAAISDSGTTYTTLTVNGSGTVSFYWKVSSESGYDKLHCYLDGTEAVSAISGSTEWAQVTLTLGSDGEHVVKWAYTKDGSVSSNSDCGWIDRVVVSIREIGESRVQSDGITNGLIARYGFNGDIRDSSAYGYDLSGTVAGWGTDHAGNESKAIYFDGARYLSPPEELAVENSITISAWVKPMDSLTMRTQGTTGVMSYSLNQFVLFPSHGGPTSNGRAGLGLQVGTNGIIVSLHCANYDLYALCHTITITDWTLVTVTVDNNGAPLLYVNGQYVKTGETVSKVKYIGLSPEWGSDSGNNSVIGGGRTGYYKGYMDEFRIYNRALSVNEISAIYVATDADNTISISYEGFIPTSKIKIGEGFQATDILSAIGYFCSGSVNSPQDVYACNFKVNGTSLRVQFQLADDRYTKCLGAEFTTESDGVYVKLLYSRYVEGLTNIGADFDSITCEENTPGTSAYWNTGYSLKNLRICVRQPDGSSIDGPFTCTQYNMNSAVSSLSYAKSYVEDSSKWASTPVTKHYQTIAFLDGGESTTTYERVPFPGNSTTSDGQEEFVVVSTATIVIPSDGAWSFSCWSDDGFELTLTRGATTYTSSYSSARSHAYTTRSFDLTAGEYELKLVYFDHTDGATCMLFAAQGSYSSFDSGAFKLLGEDTCPIGFAGDTPENGYAVAFNANGGSGTMANQRFEIGESKSLTGNAFVRTGYTFQGWATSENGSVAYSNGASVSDLGSVGATVTLYAKWTANTYQVTLSHDSTKVNAIYGSAMPSITPPTQENCRFAGYYSGANGSGTQYYTSTGASAHIWDIASNSTLYPHWVVNSYTVSFNANGGSGTMGDETFNVGEAKTLTANAFTRTGYTFAGWAESANGAVKFADGASVSNLRTQDGTTITLYAKWQGNTYQVTFSPVAQGLNVSYYDLASGTSGDTWQTQVNTYAKASTYSSKLTPTITDNTLALGDALDFGYVGSTSTLAKFHGKYATYSTEYFCVKLDGYYYASSSGSYTFKISHDDHCIVYIDGAEAYKKWGSMGQSDWNSFSVSLTAGYHEVLVWFFECTGYQFLRFQGFDQSKLYRTDPSAGSASTATATYGEPMPPVSVPSRTGYTFAGYYTGMNGTGTQYYSRNGASLRNFDCTSNLSLYPYWVLNSYSVVFNANGGTGAMVDQTFSVGETKTLTSNGLSRKGYTFQGWATTPNGSVKYSNGASVSNLSYVDGEKVTLYAVWKRNVYEQVRCGFITSTFTGSTSLNTSSDIWNNSSQYAEAASGVYATSLNEQTTIAYGTHMYMDKGTTYNFKGCYDDWVGIKVDSTWIAKNSTECKECSGSYTATYSGWHKVEFRVANNGGPGGRQNTSEYGIKWKTSQESTWRDIDATTYWPMFSVAPPIVVSSSPNSASPVASVDGTAYIHFTKIDDAPDCVLKIDGENYITSESLYDVGIWQPRTLGTHTITWSSGGKTATMSINVTSLAFPTTPEPTPPTGVDENITIKSTSKAFGSGNGSGTIATTGSGTCAVTSSADWIVIPAAMASRNAGLAIAYTVTASTEAEERTGYIYISGHVFTVTQAGVGAELDEYEAECEQEGGKGSVTVLVDSQTGWIARSNVDWISLTTTSGTGEAEVEYTVAKWEGVSTRSGTISVGGQTFTVNQTGRRMKLNTDGIEADYNAHAITITIDALATTDWGIAVDSGWLSIVDGGSGKGGCDVALAINENPSYLPRTATALIGTETYTIRQLGRPTAALAFAISPETTAASVDGANGVVGVTATPDLPWSAQSEVSWLTVMPSFASGAGNGNMIYTASPNSTMSERTGAIVISPASASGKASKRHTVTQPAATAMISTDAHTFDAAGESFDVDVTIADIVNWSISENCDWVSISGELNRVGPGKVTIAASENLTVNPRTATVTIAGHSFAVTQLGRKVEVDYTAKTFDADGLDQQEDIEVHPDGNVSWMAYASDPSWIIIWGDENTTSDADGNVYGVGDATISYMVTDYVGDGQLKQGYIVVGDKTIYITQRGYDFDINPKGTSVSGNAGAGSVAVPATIGQVWNAVATEPWIKLVGNYDEVTGNGTVNYTFTDNDTGETRTGKIVIAGVEYTITQAARQLVTITATVMGEGGLVSGGGTYTLGTSVTLNAVVNDDDHKFVQWERGGNTLSTATSLAVTADVDQEIIAVFEKIKTYVVNDEEVKEGTTKSFTAPEPVVLGGTTQLVCRGTSAYPNKGTSFQMQITGNVSFEWDLWQTNYWIAINQTTGGTVSGPAGWVAAGTEATFTATPLGGRSLYRWLGIDDIASNESSIMSLVSHPLTVSAIFGTFNDTLATSVDADALKFTTGGDANWTPVIDATAQAGCSSAKSGVIGKESETWVETTVEGPGRITFSWRVDCEKDDGGNATWDRLAVFVDGQECRRIDGTTDWQTLTVRVLDDFYRPHTIRWSFYRDDYDSPSSGSENCGWVDNIKWQSDVD